MEYKVTSKIVRLDQTVSGITFQHDAARLQRTVEWLNDSDTKDFFSLEEANQLKAYLDGKPSQFSDNIIVTVSSNDKDNTLSVTVSAAQMASGDVAIEPAIQISHCPALADYNLDFHPRGYLNTIHLN